MTFEMTQDEIAILREKTQWDEGELEEIRTAVEKIVDGRVKEERKTTLEWAAGEIHLEMRWQAEQQMRNNFVMIPSAYSIDRLEMLKEILLMPTKDTCYPSSMLRQNP